MAGVVLAVVLLGSALSQPGTVGSLVYYDNRDIYSYDLATRRTKLLFTAASYTVRGVSVSDTGVVALLQERNDAVRISLLRPNGSLLREFTYGEKLSFPSGGARLSRDGSVVAFTLGTVLDNGRRGKRVVACETSFRKQCVYFDDLADPAWLPDNRLVGIEKQVQVYVSDGPINFDDPPANNLSAVGPGSLRDARDPETTPDGRTVVFSSAHNIYALDLASGRTRALTSGGLEQIRPMVSPDGRSLFYMQECCQRTPTGSGGVATGLRIHRIALNLGSTTPTPYSQFALRNTEDKLIPSDGRYGVTIQTVR